MAKSKLIRLLPLGALIVSLPVLATFHSRDAAAQVGVTAATDGDPLGRPPGGTDRVLRVGTDVQANEVITTASNDRAHLLFLDGTTLSVGPNAQLTIDKYVYDPATQKGELAVNATKGVFRVIGGRISKTSAISVNTPSSTMGIRGGIMIVAVEQTQTTAYFIHGVSMTVSANGQTQTVTQQGMQVTTYGGGSPGSPIVLQGSLSTALSNLDGNAKASAALMAQLNAIMASNLSYADMQASIGNLLQALINQYAPSTIGTAFNTTTVISVTENPNQALASPN